MCLEEIGGPRQSSHVTCSLYIIHAYDYDCDNSSTSWFDCLDRINFARWIHSMSDKFNFQMAAFTGIISDGPKSKKYACMYISFYILTMFYFTCYTTVMVFKLHCMSAIFNFKMATYMIFQMAHFLNVIHAYQSTYSPSFRTLSLTIMLLKLYMSAILNVKMAVYMSTISHGLIYINIFNPSYSIYSPVRILLSYFAQLVCYAIYMVFYDTVKRTSYILVVCEAISFNCKSYTLITHYHMFHLRSNRLISTRRQETLDQTH